MTGTEELEARSWERMWVHRKRFALVKKTCLFMEWVFEPKQVVVMESWGWGNG